MTDDSRERGVVPLVYYYGGAPLPEYGLVTLKHMRSRWDGEIVVLHSEPVSEKLPGISYIRFNDWYDESAFEQFSKKSPLERSFRQGFWFHTAERFFVIQQWAKRFQEERFLHAELDVALYDVRFLPSALDGVGSGIFYPRASRDFSGASLMYVNSIDVFSRFLRFAQENATLGYEMRVLAEFHQLHPSIAFSLPSHSSLGVDLGDDKCWKGIEPNELGGVIDVGALGTWLLGNDPKNVGKRPVLNKEFVDGHGNERFSQLRFRYSLFHQELLVSSSNSETTKILALHIHSKCMKTVFSPLRMWATVWQLRLPWRMPIVPQYLGGEIGRALRAIADSLYLSVFKKR